MLGGLARKQDIFEISRDFKYLLFYKQQSRDDRGIVVSLKDRWGIDVISTLLIATKGTRRDFHLTLECAGKVCAI
jgi:hypothetical protein